MSIQDDVVKLAKTGAKRIVLADINTRPAILEKVGVGRPGTNTSTGGGSIASPLTETTVTIGVDTVPERTYYAERTLISTDGLFSFKVKDIKSQKFTDANDAEVVLNFADPQNEP
jgi:hypothetical protein